MRRSSYSIEAGTAQQVVQGNKNKVVFGHDLHGAIVNLIEHEPIAPRRRPSPLQVRPPRFPMMLDREEQAAELLAGLEARIPIEVVGESGIGKTVLLRHLCWRDEIGTLGGVVFKEHRWEPVEDLLQFLFESIYDAEPGFKPTPGRLRQYLRDVAAVVVIDDLNLDQADLETLRNSMPGCSLVAAAEQPQLLEGSLVVLTGLPEDAALALLERALGRSVTPDEDAVSASLLRDVAGSPRLIQQSGHLVRRGGMDLATLAERAAADGARAVVRESVARLSTDERRVLQTLALIGDTPVRQSRLDDLSERQVGAVLKSLQEKGCVVGRVTTYTLSRDFAEVLQENDTPTVPSASMVDGVVGSVARDGEITSLEDVPLIVATINAASAAGRWADVYDLCRAVEAALIDSRRWGQWRWILEREASAAQQLEDLRALGWTLHQLGTLALCYEDYPHAKELLEKALEARRRSRDREGAARTRHNLDVLERLTSISGPNDGRQGLLRRHWWLGTLAVAIAIGLFAVGRFAWGSPPFQSRQPPAQPMPSTTLGRPTPSPTDVPTASAAPPSTQPQNVPVTRPTDTPSRQLPGTSQTEPPTPPPPSPTPDNPVIVDVNTYREGPLMYVSVSYTDADRDAEGFGFRWVYGQESHPFSSPSFGRVSPGRVDYPFNLGCGQTNQYQIDVEFWIYDHGNRRSNYINVHLTCPGGVG